MRRLSYFLGQSWQMLEMPERHEENNVENVEIDFCNLAWPKLKLGSS